METIVFAPATFNLAETTRMIEVAKYLKDDFQCVFFGFSKTYSPLITDAGFDFYLLAPVFTDAQEQQIIRFDQMKAFKHPFTSKIVAQRVKNELLFFEEHQPKLILTGTNMTVFLSARIYQAPLIYVKPFALTREQLLLPESPPPKQLQKPFLPTNFIWSISKQIARSITWKPYAFRKVARNYQLTLPKYTLDLLSGDMNFITTHPMFLSQVKSSEQLKIVGPIYAQLGEKLPTDVYLIIEKAKQNNTQLIYFAMGSSGNKKLVLRFLNILSTLDCKVIAPVKHFVSEEEQDTLLGQNIHVTEFVPAHLLSKLVDLSIIHGGEGTVQTACASGKPFIGVGLQYEQELNLHYCETFGNAISLYQKNISTLTVSRAIQTLSEESYQQKALEMKKHMVMNGALQTASIIKNEFLEET